MTLSLHHILLVIQRSAAFPIKPTLDHYRMKKTTSPRVLGVSYGVRSDAKSKSEGHSAADCCARTDWILAVISSRGAWSHPTLVASHFHPQLSVHMKL